MLFVDDGCITGFYGNLIEESLSSRVFSWILSPHFLGISVFFLENESADRFRSLGEEGRRARPNFSRFQSR